MDDLLQLLTRIQEVFSIVSSKNRNDRSDLFTFELPQVVVVGDQGSGKSSVLESLIGRSFLPRGSGISTRRPIIIQLIYCSKKELARVATELSSPNLEAWGSFHHRPDRRYIRTEEIRQEIITETVRVAGDKHDISNEPINLKFFSNSVNLTFVDLPGLLSVPAGDQPPNIDQKVRKLVLHYISSPHSIILAVITASADITSNASLQLARQVDPLGIRTLVVVTKLDIINDTTNVKEILSGRIIPFRLGVIGVVNRSVRENQQGKSLTEALTDEANFLQTHYPKLAVRNGTPYLAKTLQCLLIDQIRSYMPEIRSAVVSMTNRYKNALKACGEPVLDKGQTVINSITDYCSVFCSSIKGNSNDLDTTELCGGARISYIFQESFANALDSINPLAGFNKAKILTAMRNASGTCPGLFIPELSFEQLVKRQIKQLEEPSLQCADLVYQELERVVLSSAQKPFTDLQRFHHLQRRILDVSSDLIRGRLPEAHSIISQLIGIQMAYINTNHPDFMKEAMVINDWAQTVNAEDKQTCVQYCYSENLNDNRYSKKNGLMKEIPTDPAAANEASLPDPVNSNLSESINNNSNRNSVRILDSREHHDCIVIEELIKSYFSIVKKTIQDSVPKAIMFCLVNYVMENLQQHLVSQIYLPEQFDELLIESKHVTQKRKETTDVIKSLDKATSVINEIRDFHSQASNKMW